MSKTIRKILTDSLECPACKSKNILTNKDGERRCRRCGQEWDKKDK